MQHDNSDDPYGFWNDEPTRPLRRVQAGTRAHGQPGETRMVPVVRAKSDAIASATRRNPLMTRVCVMLGAGLLVVPIGLAMGNDDGPVGAAKMKSVQPLLLGTMPPLPTDQSVPATDAPTSTAPTTTLATTTSAAPDTTAAPVTEAPTTEAPTTAAPPKKKAAVAKPAPTTAAPPAPTPAPSVVAAASCNATYTVAAGDAWSSIASRAKVSMNSLLAANNATVNTVLLPGKKICLPDGAVQPGPPTTKPPATTAPPTTAKPPATTLPPTTQPPATTAPGTTQPPPPANTYTKAQVAQIIRDVWPDDLENAAIAIATRESNLIPTVRNYCCYGLFQIYFNANKTFLASIGVTSAAQLYDPVVNASAAYAMYRVSGWGPWGGDPTATTTTVSG